MAPSMIVCYYLPKPHWSGGYKQRKGVNYERNIKKERGCFAVCGFAI